MHNRQKYSCVVANRHKSLVSTPRFISYKRFLIFNFYIYIYIFIFDVHDSVSLRHCHTSEGVNAWLRGEGWPNAIPSSEIPDAHSRFYPRASGRFGGGQGVVELKHQEKVSSIPPRVRGVV